MRGLPPFDKLRVNGIKGRGGGSCPYGATLVGPTRPLGDGNLREVPGLCLARRETYMDDDLCEDCNGKSPGQVASEKIWRSVAHTIKQIAEKHGWENESDTDLAMIAVYLAEVAGDDDIHIGYLAAGYFHTNFYEDHRTMEQIKQGLAIAEDLIGRLLAAERRYEKGSRPPNGADNPTDYHDRREAEAIRRHRGTVWGSVAHAIEQIAERHGWENETNTDLSMITEYLAAVANDDAIDDGFLKAIAYRANSYKDEFGIDKIRMGPVIAEDLIGRLLVADRRYISGSRPSNGADNPEDYRNRRDADAIHRRRRRGT